MPRIGSQCRLEEVDGFIQVLVDRFMPTERVRISTSRIKLERPSEARQSLRTLLLQGKQVTYRDPSLRRTRVDVEKFLSQEGKLNAILQLPQQGREDFHIPQSIGVFFS